MNDVEMERVEDLFQDIIVLEKQFKSLLEKQSPSSIDVATLLQSIRIKVENVLFLDIEYALSKTVEERLWTHVDYRVIDDYKKRIANHGKQYGTSRPVEYRKWIDNYTRFLKDTTNFYRTLVQRLVSHFNVIELHPIVKQFKLQVDSPPDGPKFQSKKIKSLVFTAVQTSLIKLGDISRYRALTPSRTKVPSKPDYGPAYGYYVLAQTLLPENGAPANQLAVLSTYSKDFLASTYYFYRALACDEPFATAGNNLALGFRKVLRDGVGIGGVEREDIGVLVEGFLKIHAGFYNQQGIIDDPGLLKTLEQVVIERVVTAKLLNRLTFINLSAIYVATQRQQPDLNQLTSTVLAQYTLLLQLLSRELDVPTSDPVSSITPIIRRMAPSLRLYSKWLVLHHQTIPQTFWPQYTLTTTILHKLWPKQNQPKLSYPLEEDLVSAGFAPLEATPDIQDSRKRKHKRDRARIGNRKKGFDKLLLQWGRSGGDSISNRDQDSEHPNVEMTLRLADLLSDALEIASIPVSGIEVVDGMFRVRRVDEVGEGQQFSSTGFTLEALGRMSLDDGEGKSFSEPQESSEEDLGMAFSPGKMVDDIVGDENGKVPIVDEEITFSGRATRKQLRLNPPSMTAPLPQPVISLSPLKIISSPVTTPPAPPPDQSSQPKTAADLLSRVLAFSHKPASPLQSPRTLSPHKTPIPHDTPVDDPNDPYSSFRSSPRLAPYPYDETRRKDESPVGVIGQGRASPRMQYTSGSGHESPRWGGGFSGL